MRKLFETDDAWAGLVLRLSLGIVMFPHGAQKLLGWYGGVRNHGLLHRAEAPSLARGLPGDHRGIFWKSRSLSDISLREKLLESIWLRRGDLHAAKCMDTH